MTESNFLGPDLEPPRGGLGRLQQTVKGKHKVRWAGPAYWIPAGLVAGVAALLLVIWVQKPRAERRIHQAVAQAFATRPETHFNNTGYIEIPSHRHDVRILLLGSLPHSQQPKSQSRG